MQVYKRDNCYIVFGVTEIGVPCYKKDKMYEEIEAYLKDHPEALIPEPEPPKPTKEQLAEIDKQKALSYLQQTDWIVAKVGEAQMLGKDIAPMLDKYKAELAKREESRTIINNT